MLYKLRNLKKIYGPRTVLDLDELTMEEGKVIGLLGPNGAGKTTLLEILGFLRAPTSGDLLFRNKAVDFKTNSLIHLRRRVVLVEQHPILFTSTVASNLEFPLVVRKLQRGTRERIVDELLDLVGMRPFKEVKAQKLSGGETQRIAIARALACSPEVILFDEPTANVDVENQIAIERIIREINTEKEISVIFTSHDMVQASRLADDTLFLFDGKLALSTYENIFSGRIELTEDGEKCCFIQNRLSLGVNTPKTGKVRIFIDPTAVRLAPDQEVSTMQNTFCGRMVQLTDEQDRVRALVDVGIPLSVLIPKDQFKSLCLGPGEPVCLTCPPESIEIF
ncbi:MAG: ATP-binding cassette domain-containing protein [Deltaproteobacteria bacterium]|nr:MAG: ATP-binding cassette domain-containing protein [Deltaproteobacteria bacterium]